MDFCGWRRAIMVLRRVSAGPSLSGVRTLVHLVWMAFLTAMSLSAQEAEIFKVLPHFLDQEGRHNLSPSLFERDAYQEYLRKHPVKIAALRYDVHWKGHAADREFLLLRVEVIGSEAYLEDPWIMEKRVPTGGWWGRWSSLALTGDLLERIGRVMAWRVTLWDADRLLAEETSFLWVRESHTPPGA